MNPGFIEDSRSRGQPASGLSKSRIQAGLQCAKRLYLETYSPDLAEASPDTEHRFAVGHDVGEKARALWPGGHLVEYGYPDQMVAETTRLLAASTDTVVFEATFRHDAVLIRADILVKAGPTLTLIEVKSSTRVKDYHIPDCAIQAWVIEQSGYPLSRIELAHIDNAFVYRGNGDYRGLIHREDITTRVREAIPAVSEWIATCRDALAGDVPEIGIGDYCHNPWPCQFHAHCHEHAGLPEYPVSILPHGAGKQAAAALAAEGFEDLRAVPEGRLSNARLERIRRVTASGRYELEDGAAAILARHPWPHYYLDFETAQFAVPIWAGTRPYEQLPFQWSCHIADANGALRHAEFLDTTGDAPMRPWIDSLLDTLGDQGPIFHYHSFEKTILKSTAARFPDLKDSIAQVVNRLVDLLPITREHYYHPDLRGSWSLKQVIPTISIKGLNLSYDALDEIADGGAAMQGYGEAIHPQTPPERKHRLNEALRQYCRLDTLGLVALESFLCKQELDTAMCQLNPGEN